MALVDGRPGAEVRDVGEGALCAGGHDPSGGFFAEPANLAQAKLDRRGFFLPGDQRVVPIAELDVDGKHIDSWFEIPN